MEESENKAREIRRVRGGRCGWACTGRERLWRRRRRRVEQRDHQLDLREDESIVNELCKGLLDKR